MPRASAVVVALALVLTGCATQAPDVLKPTHAVPVAVSTVEIPHSIERRIAQLYEATTGKGGDEIGVCLVGYAADSVLVITQAVLATNMDETSRTRIGDLRCEGPGVVGTVHFHPLLAPYQTCDRSQIDRNSHALDVRPLLDVVWCWQGLYRWYLKDGTTGYAAS